MEAEVVKLLQTVLATNPLGVLLDQLQEEYHKLTAKSIPYKSLGFDNLRAFLETRPNVVSIRLDKYRQVKCYGAMSVETQHLTNMMLKQKKVSLKHASKRRLVAYRGNFFPVQRSPLNLPMKQNVPAFTIKETSKPVLAIPVSSSSSQPCSSHSLKKNIVRSSSDNWHSKVDELHAQWRQKPELKMPQSMVKEDIPPEGRPLPERRGIWNLIYPFKSVNKRNGIDKIIDTRNLIFDSTAFVQNNSSQALPIAMNEFPTPLYWQFGPLFLCKLLQHAVPGAAQLPQNITTSSMFDCREGVLFFEGFILFSLIEMLSFWSAMSSELKVEAFFKWRILVSLGHSLAQIESCRLTLEPHFYIGRVRQESILLSPGSSKNWRSTLRKSGPEVPMECLQKRLRDIVQHCYSGIWNTGLQKIYHEKFQEDMPSAVLQHLRDWSHICSVKICSESPLKMIIYPPIPKSSDSKPQTADHNTILLDKQAKPDCPIVQDSNSMDSLKQHKCRISRLLASFPHGIWVHSLPDIYKTKYNMDLPVLILNNVDLVSDVCSILRPLPENLETVILYPKESSSHEVVTPTSGFGQPSQAAPIERITVPSPKLPDPGWVSAKVCSVDARGNLCVHFEQGSAFDNLTTQLKSEIARIGERSLPECKVGMACALLHNGVWTRGYIKDVESRRQISFVFLVDHGMHLLLHSEDLKTLPPKCARLPALAVPCQLSTADMPNDWPSEKNLKKLVGQIVRMRVENIKDGRCTVFLNSLQGTSLNQRLFKSSHDSIPQKEPPVLIAPKEKFEFVSVLQASSTRRVAFRYCGSNYSEMLQELEEAMLREYNCHDLEPYFSTFEGQLVAAFVDGYWYRARVISTDDTAQINVMFVDYASTGIVYCWNIRCLSDQFLNLPLQATWCQLAGLENLCIDAAVLSKLYFFAKDKALVMEVIKHSEIPEVILYDTSDEVDVNINLACLQELEDPLLAAQPEEGGVYRDVQVTHIESDGTIFCLVKHLTNAILSELLERIVQYFDDQSETLFTVTLPYNGQRCLFKCRDQWKRVEVSNIRDSVVSVLLLDVGKTITCDYSALYEVPAIFLRDFASIPIQVLKCRLVNTESSLDVQNVNALEFLWKTLLNKSDYILKVASVQDKPPLIYIHLFTSMNFDCSQSVNKMLASHCANIGMKVGKQVSPITCQILPPQQLPERGKRMDVFVSIACHPGLFALQPWRCLSDLNKLTDNMMKRYAKDEECLQLEETVVESLVYAAMLGDNWYRVLVKSLVSPNMAMVYQLDYGHYTMVDTKFLRQLDQSFLQLPFQAIWADLEGFADMHWPAPVAASFRYLVENKPMVAWVCELAGKSKYPWDRQLTVTLVDTSRPDVDCNIHDIVEGFLTSFSACSAE
uniref:tudor domain-containing protein 7B-like n=1 Tax=Myxine glutinosa TaxID=7769 RepID=UPI00358E9D28